MKVVHIITGLGTGGAERALYNLLQGGLADRFESHVVSLSDEGTYGKKIGSLGVPLHTLNMRRGMPSPKTVLRLRRIVRKIRPNIIQGWMYHGNLAAWLAGQVLPERPIIAWSVHHSLYRLDSEKRLTRQVIHANRMLSRSADLLLYMSQVSRQQHERLGFATQHAEVVPNGFDIRYPSLLGEHRAAARTALRIPSQALVIGHVARLHPMKDHPRFLRAAVKAATEFDNLHIVMAGQGITNSNPELTSLIPENQSHRFHLLGERQDIPTIMQAMDVFCLNSWSEAFPNVLGEAMALSIPCITTNVGDAATIVGDTGIIVSPRDDQALLDGLMTLLQKTDTERRCLGQTARARIENNFSLDTIVARYSMLYEQLLLKKE